MFNSVLLHQTCFFHLDQKFQLRIIQQHIISSLLWKYYHKYNFFLFMVVFLCLTFDSSINERAQVTITCALLCETTKQCGRSLKDQRCFNIGTNSEKTVKRIKQTVWKLKMLYAVSKYGVNTSKCYE